MFRLSLRLALKGGREAIIRLILTAVAVMIGVTVLLSVLSQFHGFQATSRRPCWECTTSTAQANKTGPGLSWLYRKDTYKGTDIKRLDVAALSAEAPVLPGISRLPKAGEYYASPALAKLIDSAPRDELGKRFPGSRAGIIGDEALSGPDALVIFVGRTTSELALSPATYTVRAISTTPQKQDTTNLLRFALAIGAAGLLFPMLVLIGAATRLSTARREERYAALRLVGATPRQINVIASVDAVVATALGAMLGVGVFLLLRPILAEAALFGDRFFAVDVTPTVWGYVFTLVGVPVAAAAAALLSLRQVRISPLGVSRRAVSKTPKAWSIVPLLAGVGLFMVAALTSDGRNPSPAAALPGFVLIMCGLVIAGPWITLWVARLMAKLARSASSLLAARRLTDNPKAVFRAVSGLVLAVFVGTVVASLAPALLSRDSKVKVDALSNVLTAGFFSTGDPECGSECAALGQFDEGLSPTEGTKLIARLKSYSGVAVFPIYVYTPTAQLPQSQPGNQSSQNQGSPEQSREGPGVGGPGPQTEAMRCDDLKQLAVLGECPAGAKAITTSASDPTILNHQTDSIILPGSVVLSLNELTNVSVRALFVRVSDASSLEKVRTLLAGATTSASSEVPRTFGEIRQDKLDTAVDVQRIIFIALGVTLLIAGCSLAIAMGGSLIERKRPFTLLRLSGAPLGVLYRIVLWEAILPLLTVTIVAALAGFGIAAATVTAFEPAGVDFHIESPSLIYFLTMLGSFTIALFMVCMTLPLLARITSPDNSRFE